MEKQITSQLHEIASSDEFVRDCYDLVERWINQGVGAEVVNVVLIFMESHPDIDFGTPGPLVHFIERFYGPDYKQSLIASLNRRATFQTVWLLQRVINGEQDQEALSRYVNQMRRIADDPSVDATTRDFADRTLSAK